MNATKPIVTHIMRKMVFISLFTDGYERIRTFMLRFVRAASQPLDHAPRYRPMRYHPIQTSESFSVAPLNHPVIASV